MRAWHFSAGIFHLTSFLTGSGLFTGNGLMSLVGEEVFSAVMKHEHSVNDTPQSHSCSLKRV